jgi:hypothetical protein
MRWAGRVERNEKTSGAYWVLLEKYEGMRQFGRTRRRMEDTIKVYLKEIGWEFVAGLIWFRTGTGGRLLWMR